MTSSPPVVALMSPGDMGHAVGGQLRRHGLRVITSLEGRSARTAELAAEAGIEAAASDQAMIEAADVLLSIIVPSKAEALAAHLAPAIERAGRDLIYVDCNAVAPATSRRIGEIVEAAGARFVDAGIVGPPPYADSRATRIYTSGPAAARLAVLNDHGLDVRAIGDGIGEASALKMCYAALNKGTIALITGVSIMAERMGVAAALHDEMTLSQEAVLAKMHRQVPSMVPKAHRWIGEMEEIASSFDASDLTPAIFEGIADIYRLVAAAPIAEVSPERWAEAGKTYDDVIRALADGGKSS